MRKTGLLLFCLFASLSHVTASPASDLEEDGRTRTIKGVVTDSNGETVVGATVFQKGTANGTVTSADGTFSIDIALPPPTTGI